MHSPHLRDEQLCFISFQGIIDINYLEFFYMEGLCILSHWLTYSIIYLYQYWLMNIFHYYFIIFTIHIIYVHIYISIFITCYMYLVYFIYIYFTIISISIFILWHDKSWTECSVIKLSSDWPINYHNEVPPEKIKIKFFFCQ